MNILVKQLDFFISLFGLGSIHLYDIEFNRVCLNLQNMALSDIGVKPIIDNLMSFDTRTACNSISVVGFAISEEINRVICRGKPTRGRPPYAVNA